MSGDWAGRKGGNPPSLSRHPLILYPIFNSCGMTSLGGKIEKAFDHHFLAFHCSSDHCSSDDYTSDHCSKGSWLAKMHCALFCARNPVYACVRVSRPDRAATFREFSRGLCRHTRRIQNKHAPPLTSLSLSLSLSRVSIRPDHQISLSMKRFKEIGREDGLRRGRDEPFGMRGRLNHQKHDQSHAPQRLSRCRRRATPLPVPPNKGKHE